MGMDKMHARELGHDLCAWHKLYILFRHFRVGKVLVAVLYGFLFDLKASTSKLQMHNGSEKKRRVWCEGHSLLRAYRFVIISPKGHY